MSKFKGLGGGKKGGNEKYMFLPTKTIVTRTQAVKMVDQGKDKTSTTTTINGKRYIKDKPDLSKKDNVNKKGRK